MPGAGRNVRGSSPVHSAIASTCALLLGTFALGHAPSVRADEDAAWLVVPSTVALAEADHAHVRAASAALETELAASPGVVEPTQARARFERRGSTAPLMVSHTDLDALARDAQMALYHVASGLHSRARRDVERALARADRVLESLNRESIAAQQLLDACLYLVRAYLDGKQRDEARAQALECRRLVPDVEPDGTMHPPHVIGLLAEAEAQLKLRTPGSLRIESKPAGCAVFVNGRRLGTAPLELPSLSPGEYRLQAECDEGAPGRVHRVMVGTTRVVVRIDTRFDAAVQTSHGVSLRYASESAQAEHGASDAAEVGRIVGAAYVVRVLDRVAEASDAGRILHLDRIRVADGARVAAVRVRALSTGEITPLDAAVRALRDGASLDLTGSTYLPLALETSPAPSPSAADAKPPPSAASVSVVSAPVPDERPLPSLFDPEPEDVPASDSGPPMLAGITLAATGGAALVTAWALWARQHGLERTYHDRLGEGADHTAALDDVEATEAVPPIVGAAGALVTTASLPWLLPDEPRLPIWAGMVGATGGVAAIVGAGFLVQGASCEEFDIESRCTDTLATTRFGALVLETAVPLAGVPVTYWLRHAFGSETRASLSLSTDTAHLHVRGSL